MSNYRSKQIEELAAVFAALGNPHRLRIFLNLAQCCRSGSCCDPAEISRCVGEIGEGVDIAPATLSHHLKELQIAGAIRCARRGRNVDCCIDLDTLKRIADFFGRLAPDEESAGRKHP